MDKVKITQELADLLDEILENTDKNWLFRTLSNWHGVTTCTKNMADLHSFYEEDPLLVSKAMIIGYEVEETPEDKVRKLFKSIENHNYAKSVTLQILDALNIKIEGVNA